MNAADTVYYYGSNYRPVSTSENAVFRRQVESKGSKKYVIRHFVAENNLWKLTETHKIRNIGDNEQSILIKDSPLFADRIYRLYRLKDGVYEFNETMGDKIIRSGTASSLVPLHLEGEIIEYHVNGKVKSKSEYRNNQLISNQNWLKDGTEYIADIFYSVDSIPEYSLGNAIFRNHLLKGIQQSGYDISQVNERIILGWVITEEGKLTGVHKVTGKSVVLPNILVKLVESLEGDWSPAMLDGKPVRYFMTIPFNFMNQQQSFDNLELSDGWLMWD